MNYGSFKHFRGVEQNIAFTILDMKHKYPNAELIPLVVHYNIVHDQDIFRDSNAIVRKIKVKNSKRLQRSLTLLIG